MRKIIVILAMVFCLQGCMTLVQLTEPNPDAMSVGSAVVDDLMFGLEIFEMVAP